MVEWSERKGDHIFDMAEYYEKKSAKASKDFTRSSVPRTR